MASMAKIACTDEFKRDAVALVVSGILQKQVAEDMGMAKLPSKPGSATLASSPMG
ncbi:hypothetical protein HMPREF0058_2398 [Actinomyces urogenitalis DSM 15434]|uniref:Transposase n=1 Tax=Actinomyces urogenitalis DSM 15434 TaxID=525246 RepID=C0W954_9ACTO|nr:hypothetical protein HMPREF0058_2398 [Actinomyces urogenitalis DSM 15434]